MKRKAGIACIVLGAALMISALFFLISNTAQDAAAGKSAQTVLEHAFEVNGFEYELREAQDCVRAGKLHSDVITPEQTIAVMALMDTVRAQSGLRFPFEA